MRALRAGRLAAALLAAAGGAAQAHPHGRLDCVAKLTPAAAGLWRIDLALTLDAASSAALLPRLQIDGRGQPPSDKAARLFGEMLAGMFRQSGWMLRLQPLDAAGEATLPPLELSDPAAPQISRNDQGQVVLAVQLQAQPPPGAGPAWRLACQDPAWYWAAGFAGSDALRAAAPCQAQLETPQSLADQARALQAAAQRAGLDGADRSAPGLLASTVQRASSALLQCVVP